MKRLMPRLLAVVLLAGAIVGAACEEGSDVTADQAQDRINETSDDIQAQADDAWASLRTDGERLIDEVQTRNDPEAKDQLLDRCRDAEERLRQDDNANADRINEFCDEIRDTNPEDSDAWNAIKSRFDELNSTFRS